MNFTHRTNNTIPDHFSKPARTLSGLTLVSHLSGNFISFSSFCEYPCLMNRMCKRLLGINMFAMFHSFKADHSMCMIGSSDDNCINVFLLVQHNPEVFVLLCT